MHMMTAGFRHGCNCPFIVVVVVVVVVVCCHSGPTVVLVSSLAFIGCVVLLHIWGKFTSRG